MKIILDAEIFTSANRVRPCFVARKILKKPHYDKLIIHLRLLKKTSDTTSLNISSVVSNVYTPTMPHLNTYAASRHSGIPMHHVPTISITIMILVLPPLLIIPPSYSVKPKSIDFTGFDVFYLPRKQSRE